MTDDDRDKPSSPSPPADVRPPPEWLRQDGARARLAPREAGGVYVIGTVTDPPWLGAGRVWCVWFRGDEEKSKHAVEVSRLVPWSAQTEGPTGGLGLGPLPLCDELDAFASRVFGTTVADTETGRRLLRDAAAQVRGLTAERDALRALKPGHEAALALVRAAEDWRDSVGSASRLALAVDAYRDARRAALATKGPVR